MSEVGKHIFKARDHSGDTVIIEHMREDRDVLFSVRNKDRASGALRSVLLDTREAILFLETVLADLKGDNLLPEYVVDNHGGA